MTVLIMGGSGSGKSAYAEKYLSTLLGEGGAKFYLAAMQVTDEEMQAKVERHRKLRSGKGFITIEQPTDIQAAVEKMKTEARAFYANMLPANCGALLECISNLTANEMFSEEMPISCERTVDKVVSGIELLKKEVEHLVIVTNNVFEDGIAYDKTTMEYIKAMGKINQKLAAMADRVIEIVVGLPVEVL